MSPKFCIGSRWVGNEFPPLVIAEIGINHGGNLDIAFEMVDAAFAAGAEVIKHQTHIISDEMSIEAQNVIPGNADISIYEIMSQCALSIPDEIKLKNYIESKGMLFISTPFSRAAALELKKMDIPAYKIGSGECNNIPLVRLIASFGKPIILSTGMNSIESIHQSVEIIRAAKVPFALLHCTNVYPTPPNKVRLGSLEELRSAFPDAVIGLSDHTTSNYPCLGAVALGASILERHFTDHKQRIGPDIICSMDQAELKDLIQGSQIIHQTLGGHKEPIPEESVTMDFAFASVIADKNIQKGELLNEDNLWVRRPGSGDFLAFDYDSLIGRKALNDIRMGSQIKKSDITE